MEATGGRRVEKSKREEAVGLIGRGEAEIGSQDLSDADIRRVGGGRREKGEEKRLLEV